MENTQKLIDFIESSPDSYFAVRSVARILEENGFNRLYEQDKWNIEEGGAYYTVRNGSSVIAFKIPRGRADKFLITASHTDSPAFKLKPDFELENKGGMKLSVEGYGGMLMSTWLDRPLSVAGRVVIAESGRIESRLVNIDRDLAVIPSLAIHMNRDANKGYEYNIKRDMCPLIGGERGALMKAVCDAAGVEAGQIKGFDLSLYNRERGGVFGVNNEYFRAPRIDDLQCVYSTLEGFVQSENNRAVTVFAAFDNEEVGSGTKQGALSTFLYDTLTRAANALGADYNRMVAESFMMSCDNAHALHPNYADKYDETNRAYMNGGIVIKYNANQKYTTDAVSEAVVRYICERAGAPCQTYTNRSDMAGGSTLGNLSNGRVSLNTADIGLAQLAMHSCTETAGAYDTSYMIRFTKEFYNTNTEIK